MSIDQKDFIIASRYQISPALNLVSDTLLQTEVRVELRLMNLLCILSRHAGQLVTREQLVKEIWDDYRGGDEGLTHAISCLRKLLNDPSKELIETIPKKGYILHTGIMPKEKRSWRKPAIYISAIVLIATLAVAFIQGFTSKAKEVSVPF